MWSLFCTNSCPPLMTQRKKSSTNRNLIESVKTALMETVTLKPTRNVGYSFFEPQKKKKITLNLTYQFKKGMAHRGRMGRWGVSQEGDAHPSFGNEFCYAADGDIFNQGFDFISLEVFRNILRRQCAAMGMWPCWCVSLRNSLLATKLVWGIQKQRNPAKFQLQYLVQCECYRRLRHAAGYSLCFVRTSVHTPLCRKKRHQVTTFYSTYKRSPFICTRNHHCL